MDMYYVWEIICSLWWVILIMAVMLALTLFTINVNDEEYYEVGGNYEEECDESNI